MNNKNKPFKVVSSITASTMMAAALFAGSFAGTASPSKASAEELSAPIDLNIVNEDRLGKALKERGLVKKEASSKEIEKAVKDYINEKQGEKQPGSTKNSHTHKDEFDKKTKDFLTKQKRQAVKAAEQRT